MGGYKDLLDLVDHGENGVLVESGWEAVRRESGEADVLESARKALTRVDGSLLEADQHTFAAQHVLRVLEQLHELLTREGRDGGLVGGDEEDERGLLRQQHAPPLGANI